MILDKSQTKTLDSLEGKWTSSVGDSLARHFHSQADDWDLRILGELCSSRLLERPDRSNHVFLFLENVKGLLSHGKGETFRTILTTLDELGYDAEWQVLNSKDFQVPQNRERIFIIGHSEDTVPDSYFLSEEKTAQLVLND